MQQQLKEYEVTFMPPDFCPEVSGGPEVQAALDALVARFFPWWGPASTSNLQFMGGASR